MSRIIRKALCEDIPALADFNTAMAKETENIDLRPELIRQGVETLIATPSLGFYLVAEEDGEPVGSLLVTTEWSDWRNGLFWWIQSVYVREDRRRLGIFRELYDKVRRLAEHDDTVCGFRLYVERENRTAQQTYQALGMSETHYRLFEQSKEAAAFFD
ncbi:MAG: GNAT family N-acetyltransferase [Thermodesulfobacteriota bacterium]